MFRDLTALIRNDSYNVENGKIFGLNVDVPDGLLTRPEFKLHNQTNVMLLKTEITTRYEDTRCVHSYITEVLGHYVSKEDKTLKVEPLAKKEFKELEIMLQKEHYDFISATIPLYVINNKAYTNFRRVTLQDIKQLKENNGNIILLPF